MRSVCTVWFLLCFTASAFAFGLGSLEITPVEPSLCGEHSMVVVSGQSVRLTARSFAPSSPVEIHYQVGINTPHEKIADATADPEGNVDVTVTVPESQGLRTIGAFYVQGKDSSGVDRIPSMGMVVQTSLPQQDIDSDGIPDLCDNCPDVANTDQADRDQAGAGDVCDANPDELSSDDNTVMQQLLK